MLSPSQWLTALVCCCCFMTPFLIRVLAAGGRASLRRTVLNQAIICFCWDSWTAVFSVPTY